MQDSKIYQICLDKKLFEIDGNKSIQDPSKPSFCLLMPPPNVTGSLHMGHALTFTLQDIIVRYKRRCGHVTLYQGGFDHAGIATQNVVEKELLREGILKEDLGKEEFIKRVFLQKERSQMSITAQMQRLGISPAWDRMRFTLDLGFKNAVTEAFIALYDRGLIVQGEYMINWCPKDGALSDIEVEHAEMDSRLYHLRYYFENSDEYIVVSTTRPETYFGDTAVMMHPQDPRFESFRGRKVRLPFLNRSVPIIASEVVDMNFGSGFVKVTPAHDFNDYEVGRSHNLESIVIFDENGILNEKAFEFAGRDRLEAREDIVKKLETSGFIDGIENYKNKVARCYRCQSIIEPYVSKQWFVKKDIALGSIAKLDEVSFIPKEWRNNYMAWMRDLKDWCISRQLWWGHEIPVYHCQVCKKHFASKDLESACKFCGGEVMKDENVLDTWFSSGLFALATMGVFNGEIDSKKGLFERSDFERFYPSSLLITGFDILFFWVARMIFMSENLARKIPFESVYLHGLVLDEHGKKMSKSRGNVIDPLEIIDEFGADNLRFSLAFTLNFGRGIRIGRDRFKDTQGFMVKIDNALKFCMLYAGQAQDNFMRFQERRTLGEYATTLGRFLKSRLNQVATQVKSALENCRFDIAALALYSFFWHEFCDFGIEVAKAQKDSVFELGSIFKEFISLLNPFMPFLSERVYATLDGRDLESSTEFKLLMQKRYPSEADVDSNAVLQAESLKEAIFLVNRIKALNLAPSKELAISLLELSSDSKIDLNIVRKITKVSVEATREPLSEAYVELGESCECYVILTQAQRASLKERREGELSKAKNELNKLDAMLKNPKFLESASKDLQEKYTKSHADLELRCHKLKSELERLTL